MKQECDKKIFSAWGIEGHELPCMLVSGEGPKRFSDGTIDPDCQKIFYRINACTWEEAMAIYHLRQGWEPYKPQGEASFCPRCGALIYVQGSGQCWSC